MDLPFHKIHDVRSSYGRLLFPVPFTGRWLAIFGKGLRLTERIGFHNCTVSKIY